MAATVRQSPYFQQLPDLPVSCRDLDGDTANIPIVFEDVYMPMNDVSWNRLDSTFYAPICATF